MVIQFCRMEKTLNIKWTNVVEYVEPKKPNLQMVFTGKDENGDDVKVYISKIEKIKKGQL